jgi:ABC-type antimicrobial peptide transport system permease subunit
MGNQHEESPITNSVPDRAQISLRGMIGMGIGSLKRQRTSSWLQFCTIAATAGFVAFVLAELLMIQFLEEVHGFEEEPLGLVPQLIWILAVSLLVCTISNVISMLLNITRRFREIGTMKCLGAFDGTVLALFLTEALLLGLAGGAVGAFSGSLISLVLALVRDGWAVVGFRLVSQLALAAGGTILLVMGLTLVGAAYPAWRASRMLPVEAMQRQ